MRGDPGAVRGDGSAGGRRASGRRLRRAVLLVALAAAGALAVAPPPIAASRESLPSGFYGITPATRLSEEEFARMNAAEVGTVRIPFFWQDIQPLDRRHFDWSRTDRVMERAARHGIEVLPFVQGVPDWLEGRSPSESPPLDERGREAWSGFLGALADRYGSGGIYWTVFAALNPGVPPRPVSAWQIWNEPSDPSYWRPIESAPERYAQLLELSDQVLAEADPAARVVAAGLWERPRGGIPMRRFLARLYATGGARSFDALALHPYAGGVEGVMRQIADARAVMRRAGDRGKPLWVTELGWPTRHETGGGGFVRSERRQARLLRRSFERILAERARYRIERLVWYTWRDNDLFPTCNLCRFSGLFREDLTPKPAWDAFVSFTGGSPDAPVTSPGPLLAAPP